MHVFPWLLLLLQGSSSGSQALCAACFHAQCDFWEGSAGTYWPTVPTMLTLASHRQDAVTAEEAPGPVHKAPAGPPELSEAEGTRAGPAGSPARDPAAGSFRDVSLSSGIVYRKEATPRLTASCPGPL